MSASVVNSINNEELIPPLFIPDGFSPSNRITLFDCDDNRPDSTPGLSWSLSAERRNDLRSLFVLPDLFTDSDSDEDIDVKSKKKRSSSTSYNLRPPKRKKIMPRASDWMTISSTKSAKVIQHFTSPWIAWHKSTYVCITYFYVFVF